MCDCNACNEERMKSPAPKEVNPLTNYIATTFSIRQLIILSCLAYGVLGGAIIHLLFAVVG